jgi:hypothetical protein
VTERARRLIRQGGPRARCAPRTVNPSCNTVYISAEFAREGR